MSQFRRAALMLMLVPLLWLGLGQIASGYEESPVADAGTLTGTVTLVGEVPKPKGYNLVTFPDPVYCGRISNGKGWRLLQTFQVGDGGAFRDVVILIEGIERGKPFTFQTPRIEAIDCTFKPFTTVVRNKRSVEVVNMDPAMHDIQAYETSELGPRVLFNVPLPMNPLHPRELGTAAQYHRHLPGEPMQQVVNMTKGRRVFVMQCGFHAYMESWGMAVENPYSAVTANDGSFTLTDVPPGDYTLVAWHPQTGPALERKVTVTAKGTVTTGFEFKAPTGRRSAHEMMENPHFGLEALGRSLDIRPTLELQKP